MDVFLYVIIFIIVIIFINTKSINSKANNRKLKNRELYKQKKIELKTIIESNVQEISDIHFDTRSSLKINFILAFDKVNMKIILINKDEQLFTFNKGDILKCDLRDETKIISTGETNKKGAIPRAFIGGAIAGGAGAVVGGMTSKEVHKSTSIKSSKYFIDIYTSNLDLQYASITGHESSLRKWYGYFLLFIETDIKKSKVFNNSVSDELLKLNKLKEKGVLTEEEFNDQKKKLLKQ